jgi:hypothetical protein
MAVEWVPAGKGLFTLVLPPVHTVRNMLLLSGCQQAGDLSKESYKYTLSEITYNYELKAV